MSFPNKSSADAGARGGGGGGGGGGFNSVSYYGSLNCKINASLFSECSLLYFSEIYNQILPTLFFPKQENLIWTSTLLLLKE